MILSVCLSVCMYVCMCVCLSFCLSVIYLFSPPKTSEEPLLHVRHEGS
jgi:hypothetical protein